MRSILGYKVTRPIIDTQMEASPLGWEKMLMLVYIQELASIGVHRVCVTNNFEFLL